MVLIMKTFRVKGPWTIQLYWPKMGYALGSYYIDVSLVRGRIQYKKGFAVGFELFGFGIGVMK